MDKFVITDNVITTPLCTAAREGKTDILCQLLKKGHNVNLNDNRGWTPLHEAAAHGHFNCATVLLQHEECNKDVFTYDGMSPLFLACYYQNNVDLINLLIEHGVSCNRGNTEDITPLHIASKLYKLDLVKELVRHGAMVNAQDFNEFTPLMEAIDQVTVTQIDKNGIPLEVINFLLDSRSNLSLRDLCGRTALFIAVCKKWNECVELLLQYGSDVNTRTIDGENALLVAAQSGNLSLVKLLLDHEAATDVVCKSGTVPLHHALHNGYVSVAEELMKKMDFKDLLERKKGNLESFLILAIDSGSFECFKLVMNHKIYSHFDQTPFSTEQNDFFHPYLYESPLSFLLCHHIEEAHAMSMVKWLFDTGEFSVNPVNEDFLPPLVALIIAPFSDTNKIRVHCIKQECFLKLLERGADIDFNSSKNIRGDAQIPDAVMAVILHGKCSIAQNLLLQVLANSFMCDWDDLLDWLIKYQTCNATVLHVLIKLGRKSKQSLLQVWAKVKQCSCHKCKQEFPSLEKLINEKDVSLQLLCRSAVRRWLWQKTGKSNEAQKLLHNMCIPLPVKQYIIPTKM